MRNAPSPIRANTYHDNPEGYVREFRAVPAPMPPESPSPPDPMPPASTAPLAPPAPGLVTEVERAACVALEVGEAIAEGLSPWALAGHLIGIIAAAARALRARR